MPTTAIPMSVGSSRLSMLTRMRLVYRVPAISKATIGNQATYGTGLSIEIPEGYVGLIFPRSSICKTTMTLTNSVGVIDSGYRGELKAIFRLTGPHEMDYKIGDRIGQLMIVPIPTVEIEEVTELSTSIRGTGGFGSSGA